MLMHFYIVISDHLNNGEEELNKYKKGEKIKVKY